jgi:hypothetical protein
MASGYGLNGGECNAMTQWLEPLCQTRHSFDTALTHLYPFAGPSRCFPFWQELLSCYVVNSTDDDGAGKKKCVPAMEDYYECLHHRKEVRPRQSPVANRPQTTG